MGAPKNFYNAVDLNKFGIDQISGDIAALKTTVGDEDSGLVKQVNDLDTTVGDADAGLVKDVNDLKTTVGDSVSGLVKDVTDLQSDVSDLENAFKEYTGTFEADADPITVTIAVDTFTADSLIDIYPDISHVGLVPTSVSFTTVDNQAYINIVIPAQASAGDLTVRIWG